MAAFTAGLRLTQHCQNAICRIQTGAEIANWHAAFDRCGTGLAGYAHDAGDALNSDVESAFFGIGAGLSIA